MAHKNINLNEPKIPCVNTSITNKPGANSIIFILIETPTLKYKR